MHRTRALVVCDTWGEKTPLARFMPIFRQCFNIAELGGFTGYHGWKENSEDSLSQVQSLAFCSYPFLHGTAVGFH